MPQITLNFLTSLYTGVRTDFNRYLAAAPGHYERVAMVVDSNRREETYPRMDEIPGIREWIGSRIIHSLSASTYTIRNKTWENSLGIDREDFEDDNLGLFNIGIQRLGQQAGEFPDRLIWQLAANGETTLGPDGQYFFDIDHLSWDSSGTALSASNFQSGSGSAWYLMDLSQPLKPFLYQKRRPFALQPRIQLTDPNVVYEKRFEWLTDGRSNAGYGLWQLAYKSKAALTAANFGAARTAMVSRFGPDGRPLAIRPTHLVVPPGLKADANRVINNELIASGGQMESNPWKGELEILEIPYLG